MHPLLKQKIVIIVPVHNEQDNVSLLVERTMKVLAPIDNYQFELLFVDDGSSDDTIQEIEKLLPYHPSIGYIKLSRNFGHQCALEAGLTYTDADAVITMDGDLQHPPEEIARMVRAFETGVDVVQMQRKNFGVNYKAIMSISFYTFFKLVSDVELVPNAADFRLMSKRVQEEILKNPGKGKLLRAIIPAIGFRQIHLEYMQDDRKHGVPSYSFLALYELAMHTIFKFSKFPANFSAATGLLLLFTGFVALLLHAFSILPDNKYTFFVPFFMLLAGGMFCIGSVICWYLYFILEETRREPSFIVEKLVLPATQSE